MNKELLEKLTVLYVEDEDDLRDTYIYAFDLVFFKTFFASNGLEAFEIYKDNYDSIDIIISDIKMPKLDGIGMMKKIREINKDVPVIFTTAFSDSNYLLDAMKIKADDYILKPIDSMELLESVEKIMLPKIQKEKLQEQENLIFYQNRYAEMGQMLGNIAHQWKQPLSTLAMQTDSLRYKLQSKGFDDEPLFDDIHSQIQYMSQTVRDFIEFLQPMKTKRKFKLDDMIEKSISLFKSEFKKSGYEISFDLIDKVSIQGKKNEFMQVIVSIIKNATDTIKERDIISPIIKIEQKIEENSAIITISDNAGGVDEEIIEKIFNKNFTSRKNADGSGIGLYLSNEIIKSFDGKLSVKNIDKFGKGVEFTIKLPISEE
jgi:signal transduction histidine kinase